MTPQTLTLTKMIYGTFSALNVFLGCESVCPPTGVEIAKIGERGFRGISQCPRNGRFESKNPHFSTGLHKENGDFLTQSAHVWDTGKWEFFDPEALFSCEAANLLQAPKPRKFKIGEK